MVQTPLNLGQRILDAARIAQAIHRELESTDSTPALRVDQISERAGGAGRISLDRHDHDDNSN
jgi:hypothetical protein